MIADDRAAARDRRHLLAVKSGFRPVAPVSAHAACPSCFTAESTSYARLRVQYWYGLADIPNSATIALVDSDIRGPLWIGQGTS